MGLPSASAETAIRCTSVPGTAAALSRTASACTAVCPYPEW